MLDIGDFLGVIRVTGTLARREHLVATFTATEEDPLPGLEQMRLLNFDAVIPVDWDDNPFVHEEVPALWDCTGMGGNGASAQLEDALVLQFGSIGGPALSIVARLAQIYPELCFEFYYASIFPEDDAAGHARYVLGREAFHYPLFRGVAREHMVEVTGRDVLGETAVQFAQAMLADARAGGFAAEQEA